MGIDRNFKRYQQQFLKHLKEIKKYNSCKKLTNVMSSKINSNLLKKNNYCNWNQFNDFKTKEEISFYFYKNSVIYKILKKLFTNFKLYVLKIKLFQTNNLLHILISYFYMK